MREATIEEHIYNLLSNAELLDGSLIKIFPVKQVPHQNPDTKQDSIYLPSLEYKRNGIGQELSVDDQDIGDAFSFTFFINAEEHISVVDIEKKLKRIFVKREPVETDDGPITFDGDLDSFVMGEDLVGVMEYYVRSTQISGNY